MNVQVRIDEAKVEDLVHQGRELVEAVEAHRADARILLGQLVDLERELSIAVPDEGDLRFDHEGYGDAISCVLVAISGLQHGIEVPDDLMGAMSLLDWHYADRQYDADFAPAALKPSDV